MVARTYRTPMRADVLTLLTELAGHDRLVHLERIAARSARFGTLTAPLPSEMEAAFGAMPLWAHQAAAIDHARAGRSVVVATGTASGKSLCYQLPIAEAVAGSPPGSALLVFPTKALAQDQLRALTALGIDALV